MGAQNDLRRRDGTNMKKPKMTKEERRKKYTDIARKRRQKQNQNRGGWNSRNGKKEIICYLCRQSGHTVGNCPNSGKESSNNQELLCYKCGSTEHSLSACPKRNSSKELPFATCFLCKEKGHLVSGCPQNKKGIYVNGGSCRYCGGRDHLATACPEKKKKNKINNTQEEDNTDIDDLLDIQDTKVCTKVQPKPTKRRVVKF